MQGNLQQRGPSSWRNRVFVGRDEAGKKRLVPTDANLRDDYDSWGELVDACAVFMRRLTGGFIG